MVLKRIQMSIKSTFTKEKRKRKITGNLTFTIDFHFNGNKFKALKKLCFF